MDATNLPVMSGFDAILFDLDGTLVDSVEDIALAVNHVRQRLDMPALPLPTVKSYVGDGVRLLFQRALDTRDESLITQAVEWWRPYYLEHCLANTRPYPGIMSLLDSLKHQNIPMAVVSNKNQGACLAVLDGLKMTSFFKIVVGGDSTSERKPDAAPFQLALQSLGVPASESLMVGDSLNDILGARNLGMKSVGVAWGLSPLDEMKQADFLVHRADEILSLTLQPPVPQFPD